MYNSKIKGMLVNQDKLNIKTAGSNWRDGLTSENRKIDWLRCIRKEAGELIDSYPWEHWKSLARQADKDNALIEATDIWFFLMSYYISSNNSKSLDYIANTLADCFEMDRLTTNEDVIAMTEELIKATFMNNGNNNYLIYKFIKVMDSLGITLSLLEDLYYGKLCLNKFRQDNGYKEGRYNKIWGGREDNKHMLDLIREQPGLNESSLYTNLQYMYNDFLETGNVAKGS